MLAGNIATLLGLLLLRNTAAVLCRGSTRSYQLLFLDILVKNITCTAVLEHSGTAAWAHCCTLALALPGIVVEVPASPQTDTLGVEFQNIFVPQLFSAQFHIAALEL